MFSHRIKGYIRFPKFNLKKDLKEVAVREIIPDIHTRMARAIDLHNKRYGKLADSTLKQRNKKRQGFLPLKATGQLRKSITSRYVPSGVLIYLKSHRKKSYLSNQELADILQNIGVKSKMYGKRKFEFFGISRKAEKRSFNYMKKKVEEAIKNARRRNI